MYEEKRIRRLRMNKLIIIALLGLVFLSGCDSYTQGELDGLNEGYRLGYDLGKLVGESCGDEIIEDRYNYAYESCLKEIKNDIYSNCMLIVTDGSRPELPDSYGYLYAEEDIFGIRTLDTDTAPIEGLNVETNGKYWVACHKR